jgi:TRAP-type uncharacterized transport system substrate-binding protein
MIGRSLSAALPALSICGAGLSSARAADIAAQRDLVNGGVVGLISGGVTGTYVRIAADLADALDDGYELRILPFIGKGSVRNIEDLLLLRGVDVAIVQSDVLDFHKRAGLVPNIDQKIRYITQLYNEEAHVLARSENRTSQSRAGKFLLKRKSRRDRQAAKLGEIRDGLRRRMHWPLPEQRVWVRAVVDDLAGKRVNFGIEGSSTFMTAGIVFDDLGMDVNITSHPEPIALEKLRAGEIDALVFVGGKPLKLIQDVGRQDGVHLLAIPPGRIKAAYVPSELTADVYPNLIEAGNPVQTVAVAAVLAAYNWPDDHPRRRKLNRFIERFFANFDRLLEPPFHPKWREVDLRAPVPGWQRIAPAENVAIVGQ